MNKVYVNLSILEDENKQLRNDINHLTKQFLDAYSNYLRLKIVINTLKNYIHLDESKDKKMLIVCDNESYISFEIPLEEYLILKDIF